MGYDLLHRSHEAIGLPLHPRAPNTFKLENQTHTLTYFHTLVYTTPGG